MDLGAGARLYPPTTMLQYPGASQSPYNAKSDPATFIGICPAPTHVFSAIGIHSLPGLTLGRALCSALGSAGDRRSWNPRFGRPAGGIFHRLLFNKGVGEGSHFSKNKGNGALQNYLEGLQGQAAQ